MVSWEDLRIDAGGGEVGVGGIVLPAIAAV
jgi:hypothetical protein